MAKSISSSLSTRKELSWTRSWSISSPCWSISAPLTSEKSPTGTILRTSWAPMASRLVSARDVVAIFSWSSPNSISTRFRNADWSLTSLIYLSSYYRKFIWKNRCCPQSGTCITAPERTMTTMSYVNIKEIIKNLELEGKPLKKTTISIIRSDSTALLDLPVFIDRLRCCQQTSWMDKQESFSVKKSW